MAKKQSVAERMRKKKEDIRKKSSKGNLIFIKADTTTRVRILNVGEENEFLIPITHFYLGGDIKGVISPVTIDEPCAIMEAYNELKNSSDPDDKELAKKFSPKEKFLALVVPYKDLKGKEVDEENAEKFIQLTSGLYDEITDYYLDEDDWGDMTDFKKGYDIKLKRTGSGKTDTEYNASACPKTPTPKKYCKVYDNMKELKAIIPSYEETKEIITSYLGLPVEDDEAPRKKKKIVKKKKKKSDI